MKKIVIFMVLVIMLCGCSAAQTFEKVEDTLDQPVMGQMEKVSLTLPDSAASPVVNTDDGARLYLCDGYSLMVQTLSGGDMDRTVKALCGFDARNISLVESRKDGVKRYEWVWSAAGEAGDQVGRAVVIPDGGYHYCVSVMAPAQTAGALEQEWTALFDSLKVG